MANYRHSQTPWWLNLLLVVLAAHSIVIAMIVGPNHFPMWIAYLSAGLFLALIPIFGKLTVEVTPTEIVVTFGVGLLKRKIPLSDVKSCETVTNKWYYGWGIRYTGEGWMWNISGLQAVKLTYEGGKSFRIGTDEPDKLQAAINEGIEGTA